MEIEEGLVSQEIKQSIYKKDSLFIFRHFNPYISILIFVQ